MSKKLKKELRRCIIALSLFLVVKITDLILEHVFYASFPCGLASIIPNVNVGWLLPFFLYLAIYIYIGHDVIKEMFINVAHGQIFDENFLMVVATFGAIGLGIYTSIANHKPEGFDEGCAVLIFYQLGEWFQDYAVGKSRGSISSLMDIRPDYANLKKENGEFEQVDPSVVKVGDIILIKPGEKIPLDGVIIKGSSTLDNKALTGESLPVDVEVGENIISGGVNLTGTIEVKVKKEFGSSTVSKILDLVENASNKKSKSEQFITKFARYYTPTVVISALLVAILPPLFTGFAGDWSTWPTWIYRALNFLVVSCPCALVISIPLSFFAGIGGASGKGILIKGSIYLEKFNSANIFVFDKTGTLTKGNFKVCDVYPSEKKEEILHLAAIAESNSDHPIAESIKYAYGKEIKEDVNLLNIAGKGVKATIKNEVILCGNNKLMDDNKITYSKVDANGTIVYVAKDNIFLGYIVIEDELKGNSKDLISYLKSTNAKTVMLTGDNEKIATNVANILGISEYKYSLLPQDKIDELENIIKNKDKKDVVAFVGDGINDAPSLMEADIGISMGGVGSDAAIEASDIVLMHDDLSSLVTAKKIAKKTMTIVYENIYFALIVKVAILFLSAFGITNMWVAVFGDVGVAVIAILNAMRANSKKY